MKNNKNGDAVPSKMLFCRNSLEPVVVVLCYLCSFDNGDVVKTPVDEPQSDQLFWRQQHRVRNHFFPPPF